MASYVSLDTGSTSSSLLPPNISSSSDSYSLNSTTSSSEQATAPRTLVQKLHPYRYYLAIALATLVIVTALAGILATRQSDDSSQYLPITPSNSTGGGDGGGGGGGPPGPFGPGGESGEGSTTGGSDVSANSSCAQAKILTEGPYWVDEKLNRSDLYSTAPGQQLSVEILVFNTTIKDKCVPIVGAWVDLWTSDATGLYSDEQILGTKGKTFLRGYQVTNSDGLVSFLTTWPGWYSGRTVHFHFRVRVLSADGKTIIYNQTTQLFVDDTTSDAIFAAVAPYNTRKGTRDTYNKNDMLYSTAMFMNTTGSIKDGFHGSFALGVPFVR